MARRRNQGRNINGIILLDKPTGQSSNEALQTVKRLFNARKAGHTGSLDPLASGLLPVCLGEATKVSAFLLDADKHYKVRCRLGQTTTTADAEGTVTSEAPVDAVDEAAIVAALAQFRGPIQQIPPMHSAVKHKGQRLYKLAREGVEVEREPRQVTIHSLTMEGWDSPFLDLDVRCTKGTYVRTLAEDIGAVLGCGAFVSDLRRLGVGPYNDPEMLTLEQLQELAMQGREALDGACLPLETALSQWPEVKLSEDMAFYVKQGQPVQVARAPTSGWVRLMAPGERFLGMGQIMDDGRVAPKRLLNTQ